MNRRQFMQALALVSGAGVVNRLGAALTDSRSYVNILNTQQREMCAAVAELIIPETDSPGAKAAGVPSFIERMVSVYYNDNERNIFIKGLNELDKYCLNNFDDAFLRCSTSKKTSALEAADLGSRDYKSSVVSEELESYDEYTPFFHKIKELSVVGYFSSKTGIENEMYYLAMPMEYQGDATLKDANYRQFIS